MKKIVIVYGSSTDNTKNAADAIAKKLSDQDVTLLDVANLKQDELDNYPNLILGTSTWGLGDLQDDWDSNLSKLENSNLTGKVVAFFGLGDSSSYSDTFADGIGILYESVKDKGCKLIGSVSVSGYSYDASRAEVDGNFVGLVLDEDNESNLTGSRIDQWVAEILPQFQ